jgi:hypothetical protein
MATGHIYATTCEELPGVMKVGFTLRTPEIRIKEHNRWNFLRPTMSRVSWKMVFEKKVYNARRKERILKVLLSKYWIEFAHVSERSTYTEIYGIAVEKFLKYYRIMIMVEKEIEKKWDFITEEKKKYTTQRIIQYGNYIMKDSGEYEMMNETGPMSYTKPSWMTSWSPLPTIAFVVKHVKDEDEPEENFVGRKSYIYR